MGYRQVIIKKSDRMSLKDNKLVVNKEGEDNLIPLEDINFIMLEDEAGTQTSIPNVLKLENENFFKLPKGACTLKVKSQTGYLYKVIMRILTAYKGV